MVSGPRPRIGCQSPTEILSVSRGRSGWCGANAGQGEGLTSRAGFVVSRRRARIVCGAAMDRAPAQLPGSSGRVDAGGHEPGPGRWGPPPGRMWPCCGASRRCSVRWRRPPRCDGSLTGSARKIVANLVCVSNWVSVAVDLRGRSGIHNRLSKRLDRLSNLLRNDWGQEVGSSNLPSPTRNPRSEPIQRSASWLSAGKILPVARLTSVLICPDTQSVLTHLSWLFRQRFRIR